MVKFKQKLSILALLALVGVQTQVQARGQVNNSTVSWGQIGATGAALVVLATATYGAYKWWSGNSNAGKVPGLPTAPVAPAAPAVVNSGGNDKTVETKAVPTQGFFAKWVWRSDDLPQIEQELLAQKLSSWKDGSGYNLQSGACLAAEAAHAESTVLRDFLQDNGFKSDDLAQLNQVKSKLQAEQAALKQLSIRLADKIDKQAMQMLNSYLATKKAASGATVVSFGFDSLQQADVFAQTASIAMSKDAVSWQGIYDDLTKAEGGMCRALIAKDEVKYTRLIKLWLAALIHYGRAKALEKLVDAHIKQVAAQADEAAAAKQELVNKLSTALRFLQTATVQRQGDPAVNFLLIHPDHAAVMKKLFDDLLVQNGHTDVEEA